MSELQNGDRKVPKKDLESCSTSSTVLSHEWEQRLLPDGDAAAAQSMRENARYRGFLWRHGKPLLITHVDTLDNEGRKYHWDASRHRNGRRMAHELLHKLHQKVQERHKIRWFAWLEFWKFPGNDAQLGWWSAMFFLWGGIMFAISGLAGGIKGVVNTSQDGPWSIYSWLVCYTSIAGTDLFFLPGVVMVLIQSGNSDYSLRVHNWEQSGRQGQKPRYQWFLPLNRHSLISWASWIMLSGKLCFSTAFTAFGVSTSVVMSVPVQRWVTWVPGTYGSICFAIFGLFQGWETSHSSYKAIIPVFPSTFGSLGCWASSMNFWGGAFFTLGSAGFLGTTGVSGTATFGETVVFNVCGFFLGSICFIIASFLQWLLISNPELD